MAPRGAAKHLRRQETSDLLPAADVEVQMSPFALPGASLTFRDLGFSVTLPTGEQRTILEPCSGHLEAGQLVALMGPSGCGKSTLLDMLAMKKTAAHTGEVRVNGHLRDPRLFRRLAAYVPQEDVMPSHWTVREAVQFNATLKQTKGQEASSLVELLLEAFGLGLVAGTYIGGHKVRGISGGQRRRVTLARGVAAQASLLFCDEPTSGLSATDAELCAKALRIVAKKLNVLVVVVIHQPRVEVGQLFDTVVMLTSNPGRMAFFGSMPDMLRHLKECGHPVPNHANPTDFFLDRLTPGAPADASAQLVASFWQRQRRVIEDCVSRAFRVKGLTAEEMLQATQTAHLRARMDLHPLREACEGNPTVAQATRSVHAGPFTASYSAQFTQLLRRKITITLRNPVALGVLVLLPILQGLVVGCMFQGIGHKAVPEQFPFVFIMLTILCLSGMELIPILIDERNFMKYETSEALYDEGISALASFCVDVPLALLGSALNVSLMYLISGQPFEYAFTIFGWAMLLFFVFDSLFGLIGALAVDASQAQAAAIPFIAIFMLFNGWIITRDAAPAFLRWIFWFSPNAYAFQAIVMRIGQDKGPEVLLDLQQRGFSADYNVTGVCVMVAMVVVLRSLQLVALRYCHNIQK